MHEKCRFLSVLCVSERPWLKALAMAQVRNGLGPVNMQLQGTQLHRRIFHGPNPMELPREEPRRRLGKENAASDGVWRCLGQQELPLEAPKKVVVKEERSVRSKERRWLGL